MIARIVMKTIPLILSPSVSMVFADQAGRKHAENDLHACNRQIDTD